MIRYSSDSWYTVFAWWGGINREIVPSAIQYAVLLSGLYHARLFFNFSLPDSGAVDNCIKAIMSLLIFMSVFRLNQCMSRHYAAVSLVNLLFMHLERLTADFCMGMKPTRCNSEEPEGTRLEQAAEQEELGEGLAIAAKVNAIRLILAYGTALMLHFQMLSAAQDARGVLDQTCLKHVVFLYCRLQMLLLPEELKILDHSLSITQESAEVFRVELNRFRLNVDPNYEVLIGVANEYRDFCSGDGVTIAPAPKIVMVLLLFALQRPMDQPWGYSSRSYNLYWRSTEAISQMMMNLESLVQSPTPLAYLQHCRVMFIIFVFFYPMSIPLSDGLTVNVVVPGLLFWAVRGFQILSKRLEDPLGNDEADINIPEKLHSLEVNSEKVFDLSADTGGDIRRALHWTEQWVTTGQAPPGPSGIPKQSKADSSFRRYFRWMPIPTVMLKEMMESHGEVDVLHALRGTFGHICCCVHRIRHALRLTTWRIGGTRHMHGGKGYQSVDVDPEEDKYFNCDPRVFCHYLGFLGSFRADSLSNDGCLSSGPPDNWYQKASRLLGDQPAASLVRPVTDEDTERSILTEPSPLPGSSCFWERLS